MDSEIQSNGGAQEAGRSSLHEVFCFRWWYKGRTAEGNTMKLEGRVEARDASEACDKVEKQMRAEWPTVRWMQGREIEGDGVTFGPTVQKLKTPIAARKQNAVAHREPACGRSGGAEC